MAHLSLAFVKRLDASQRPRLITPTSQMRSLEQAGSDRVACRTSKAAGNMAMRTLAPEWQPRRITVCMLQPGWVRTEMGGSNAVLGTIQSATGLLRVIDGLTLSDTGRFLDYDGKQIPW